MLSVCRRCRRCFIVIVVVVFSLCCRRCCRRCCRCRCRCCRRCCRCCRCVVVVAKHRPKQQAGLQQNGSTSLTFIPPARLVSCACYRKLHCHMRSSVAPIPILPPFKVAFACFIRRRRVHQEALQEDQPPLRVQLRRRRADWRLLQRCGPTVMAWHQLIDGDGDGDGEDGGNGGDGDGEDDEDDDEDGDDDGDDSLTGVFDCRWPARLRAMEGRQRRHLRRCAEWRIGHFSISIALCQQALCSAGTSASNCVEKKCAKLLRSADSA